MSSNSFDVIIIGGGATGAGVARDCSLRGLRVALIEQADTATGATGRNHGLLHSGARYAVTDTESAQECIRENITLKRIASHCIEPCGGMFLTLEEDDIEFQRTFVEACRHCKIDAKIIDPAEAMRLDRSINPKLKGAVTVPDGSIDPFRLTASNIIDAQKHEAKIFTYHQVCGLLRSAGQVTGVEVISKKTGERKKFHAPITINAAGIWGQKIAKYADINIDMLPAKGSLLVFGHRVNQMVINRCRKPADADILVPGDTISIIGTTSTNVDISTIDNMRVTIEEVETLLREGSKLSPQLAQTRILRAYAGVRPLVCEGSVASGRNASRGIVLLDHKERDGVDGLITITGGKLMTYRLMAEMATDLVCRKLSITKKCLTAEQPLPGSTTDTSTKQTPKGISFIAMEAARYRHGDIAEEIFRHDQPVDGDIVCECEGVTTQEIRHIIKQQGVRNLNDLRRRTRLGMGTCQGGLCACRAAQILAAEKVVPDHQCDEQLLRFFNERWKGIHPVAWGESLREAQYTSWVYGSVCGLGKKNTHSK